MKTSSPLIIPCQKGCEPKKADLFSSFYQIIPAKAGIIRHMVPKNRFYVWISEATGVSVFSD
jgi:hypothetical protein